MIIPIDKINEQDLLSLHLPIAYLRFRRVCDFIIILAIAPFALVIGLIVALIIKLNSQGPALFIQKRPGKDGTFFNMCKFRTMTHVPKGEEDWTSYKHRITKLGAFLRKHRIDELPQIINILKGDMSIVGPRPEPAEYFIECTKQIPLYKYRFLVPPGVTGWAQVHFRHTDDIDGARTKLSYDLFYLYNISLKLDLAILWRTIYITFIGKQSG